MTVIPPVLLPAACLPDTEFFCWLTHAPAVTIEIHETFPKQTCRNRYKIATSNGLQILSVPVNKPLGNHTPTAAVEIDRKSNWNMIHWRALESAYNKSPFFLYYRDQFEALFMQPPVLLTDFNFRLLETCIRLIRIPGTLTLTERYIHEPENLYDMRRRIMPKRPGHHQWSITEFGPYIQVFSEKYAFIPNLSILDMIFNLGPETADYLKKHRPGIGNLPGS